MSEAIRLLVVALLSLAACKGGPPPPQGETPDKGPIEIAGEPGERAVTLEITFLKEMNDVEVEVKGVQGLVVRSERYALRTANVRARQREAIRVEYTRGPVESYLVVSVRWSEGSVRRTVGRTFLVGK